MTIWRMMLKEAWHRKINFISGLLSVVISVAVFVGVLLTLALLDAHTQAILTQKEKETKARMADLQDDYRKITKLLGFNLLILPAGQDRIDFFAEERITASMPEGYAAKLLEANIVTIQHILPSLQQKIRWPEKDRSIILIGTRGEISPPSERREPLLLPVPEGRIVLGYELASTTGLRVNDRLTLCGETFIVQQCNEERGNQDDISAWIDLKKAQQILQRPGQINAILALKCHCAGNDIASVRRDIARVLPGVQVVEQGRNVLARAEARDRASAEAVQAMAAEIENRQKMRREIEEFSAILTPLVFLVSVIWMALLFFANVRDRKSEIGILRACGASGLAIMTLFLSKALLMGIAGSVLGYVIGAVMAWYRQPQFSARFLFEPPLFFQAVLTAIILSLAASWMPAFYASRQDPALVLREE
jgi:putative ABC transport system permease protein